MKSLYSAALLLAVAALPSAAQAYDFSRVQWPERLAIGERAGEQMPPLDVEASVTGWISINLLSTRPDIGALSAPPFRMMVDAADLRAWIKKVRPVLRTLSDTSVHPAKQFIMFGKGAYKMGIYVEPFSVHFQWQACGPGMGGAGPSRQELLDFVNLLDTAAAFVGGIHARPPTRARPYYSVEVSCPVVADVSNHRPGIPPRMSPPVGAVAAQFVVDTAGHVEKKSIRLMASVDAQLADSVRDAISHWRFSPAQIDGYVVSQVVQMAVPVGPLPITSPIPWQEIETEASPDGWVKVRRGEPEHRDVNQEWYEPDSVEAFVAHLRGLESQLQSSLKEHAETRRKDSIEAHAKDSAQALLSDSARARAKATSATQPPKDTTFHAPRALLSAKGRSAVSVAWVKNGSNFELQTTIGDCWGNLSYPMPLGDGSKLIAAARQARLNRSVPADPAATVHESNDVTCRAWDPWMRTDPYHGLNVWRYPAGAYPASMAKTNARAEVLVSFVVDTSGDVDMSTLEIMPGSDPRAVAQVQPTLAARRFRPARRSGKPVPQRVIEAIRFEPPPICVRPSAGPVCVRRYSPR